MTDHSERTPRARSTQHAFHALVVMGLICLLGIMFALTFRQNQDISTVENRRLAIWPTISLESLVDGSYTKGIEAYVSDHFPARKWLTEAAFAIRHYRGLHLNDRVIQVKGAETGFEDVSTWAGTSDAIESEPNQDPHSVVQTETSVVSETPTAPELAAETDKPILAAVQPPPEQPATPAAQETPAIPEIPVATDHSASPVTPTVPDKPTAPVRPAPVEVPKVVDRPVIPPERQQVAPNLPVQSKPLNVVGGVLLHDGQALFMFQGTDRGAQGYANAVNTWVELVAKKRPGMTSTVVVTPTSSHFYLPPAARARTTSEAKNLAAMRAALIPEVRFADVISEMEGNQEQALFFKSDHHWTGLGAYYAYRAWAKVAGVQPLALSAFDKRSVPGVAGSFWSLTQAPELRNADKESFYYVPTTVTFDGTQYAGSHQKTPIAQPFFAEKSRGYIVFLGGDIPLLVSNTSAGTGRTALVVKNSYGNAFAPYLLPHFDRVVVLDYRYVSRNIQEIVDTFGVTDLVFVNATITANSGAHQERMRQVARGSSTAWLTEAEKRRLKQQQEAAEANVQHSPSSGNPSQ